MLEYLLEVDRKILELLAAEGIVEYVAQGVTAAGAPFAAGFIALTVFLAGRRTTGVKAFISVLLASSATSILKVLVGRPRPAGAMEAGFSFPSGHATASAALAAAVYLDGEIDSRAFIALAAMVGLTRVVLGVHYLSDVLAGVLVGYLTALLIERNGFAEQTLEKSRFSLEQS